MVKINRYYRQNGTYVKSHTRGFKTRKKRNELRLGLYARRRIATACWAMMIICSGGIALNYTERPIDKTIPQAEASAPITNLTKEGFESADMPRDTIERERPETIEAKIKKAFGKDGDNAIKISKCESRLNPLRVNDTPATGDYSIGLFQINLYKDLAKTRPTEAWLKNPDNNINFAKILFDASKGRWSKDWTRCAKLNNLK